MSSTLWGRFQVFGVAIGSAIAFSANSAIGQITQDATLPNNSRIITNDNIRIIEGGTQAGSNLFHSFEQFSVPTGSTAYFNNALDIQNIISRVTGKSVSNIDGTLQANGTANLFLINPNGIIFGPNASLNIGGSFLASTASSMNFADDTKFSAMEPPTTPLLTVSVPIGLQFGATAAPIRNQSQVTNNFGTSVGLQVPLSKTLALVGGDVTLEGGNLTAQEGRIELGSVAGNSFVSMNATNQGWALGYEGVQNFQNIQLIARTVNGSDIPSYVNTSGEGGGNIQVQGKRLLVTSSSSIFNDTLGSLSGGNLTVNATESVELLGFGTPLTSVSFGDGNAGNLIINTGKLVVRDGAQVSVNSTASGSGGQLIVKASESVELIGGYLFSLPSLDRNFFLASGLFSSTSADGNAGSITINTQKLYIQGGATVTTQADGLLLPFSNQFIPATGTGGNLTVNASKSVEITGTSPTGSPSSLFASTQGSGAAGNVTLKTEQLIVRDGGTITVSGGVPEEYIFLGDPNKLGEAGELNITARSILLDNQGKLTSETDLGNGGNIKLQVEDLLLMRRNSQISTNAGKAEATGDGGNIIINSPNGFIVATPSENSDITANAFTDAGGRVQIQSSGIFSMVQRSREDLVRLLATNEPSQLDPQRLPTNDITAISQTNPNLSGQVNINTIDTDPSRGLVELPMNLADASQLIATGCNPGGQQSRSSFITTGRGGITPSPTEPLLGDGVLADWINLEDEKSVGGVQSNDLEEQSKTGSLPKVDNISPPDPIVEAQGWVVNAKGEIALVADTSTVTPRTSLLTPASCN
ncbi:filamentous hemagglutinin N-terminal domain-containing protein [Chlorogloeopsis sp. ULAP01]|uniref:two-partner secretion domain-containing protein n=1 Tax=Chlorogloeopsis sp. ULAP01 TaxID=3056483 RepID=UPI0025AA9B42|nr:filamentous hemagglutinin N-terminal domain-containing protein [Chlorogloeopsis sp. ULAP01]MDM9381525.1 filamentous hemagglutinin N-terminal domain-containing protein [Chlorogloeopsis sp. ULAP01]